MSSPLEIYRAWEIESPRTVMHALIINRGDGSAANRLTVTDKPYVDKGVGGVRYHHTRPAPIQSIVSDIGYSVEETGSSFDDVLLVNGDGKFNWMISDPAQVIGKTFSMLRGDQRWSILSKDLPERFVEIFAGLVDDVRPERNGGVIRLTLIPFKYNLDKTFGGVDEPLLIGGAIGVPMTLVDEVEFKYRYSFGRIQENSTDAAYFRDRGLELTLTTDYAYEDESSVYKGLIDLVAEPDGTVTGHVRASYEGTGDCPAAWFTMDYVRPEYHDFLEGKTSHAFFSINAFGLKLVESVGKMYVASESMNILQYSLVDGAAIDSTYDTLKDLTAIFSGTVTAENFVDFDVSSNGQYLYVLLRGPTQTLLLQRSVMSTPGLISSAGSADQSTTSLQGFSSTSAVTGMRVSEDGARIFVSIISSDRIRIHELELTTPYSISGSLTGPGGDAISLHVPATLKSRSTGKFCFFDDGRSILIITDPSLGNGRVKIEKVGLVTPGTLVDGAYYDGRYIDLQMIDNGIGPNINYRCSLSAIGSKVYYLQGGPTTSKRAVFQYEVGDDIPRGLFSFQPFFTNGDVATYDDLHSSCYFSGETQAGSALLQVISPLAESFLVSPDGEIYSIILSPPDWEYAPASKATIKYSDLVGTSADYVEHIETRKSPSRLVVRYAPNFAVQSPTELGDISLLQKEVLSKQWREKVIDYVGASESKTIVHECYWFMPDNSVLNADLTSIDPDTITDRLEVIYSQDRFLFNVKTSLRAIPYFDFVRLGSMLTLDFDSSICAAGDRFQLHGRRVNFSKNNQTLKVYK